MPGTTGKRTPTRPESNKTQIKEKNKISYIIGS